VNSHSEIIEKILRGDVAAAARLIRNLDDGEPEARESLKALFHHAGRAVTIGLTGSPGVGKSCLAGILIEHLRRRGLSVGVLAVDPSSPLSGGAVLGDRVRMQRYSQDEGVFIRSLASRGQFGGLARSARGALTVMDAMGMNIIIIETVGVGQVEIDIARIADTTMIVLAPGMGDNIQAIKAGILEVGDIFAINKADCQGADQTAREIGTMLQQGLSTAIGERDWLPPVLKTVSIDGGQGIDELWAAVEAHRAYLLGSGSEYCRRLRRFKVKQELVEMVRQAVVDTVIPRLERSGELDRYVESLLARQEDPYTLCEKILKALA
jgi:LAO/AO transport system kinase